MLLFEVLVAGDVGSSTVVSLTDEPSDAISENVVKLLCNDDDCPDKRFLLLLSGLDTESNDISFTFSSHAASSSEPADNKDEPPSRTALGGK